MNFLYHMIIVPILFVTANEFPRTTWNCTVSSICLFYNLYWDQNNFEFIAFTNDSKNLPTFHPHQLGSLQTIHAKKELTIEKSILSEYSPLSIGYSCNALRDPMMREAMFHLLEDQVGGIYKLSNNPPKFHANITAFDFDLVLFSVRWVSLLRDTNYRKLFGAMVNGNTLFSYELATSFVKFDMILLSGYMNDLGLQNPHSTPLDYDIFNRRIRSTFITPTCSIANDHQIHLPILHDPRKHCNQNPNMKILAFIHREDGRNIHNRQKITIALKSTFHCALSVIHLVLEKIPFRDQLSLFCKLDMIVFPHSSAFANIPFLPKHVGIIEVRQYALQTAQFSWYIGESLAKWNNISFYRTYENLNYQFLSHLQILQY